MAKYRTIVDPPSGWRYGFPREVPEDVWNSSDPNDFKKWVLSVGYSRKLVDDGMLKHIRVWGEEIVEDTPDHT